jgi:parallel beta-helix repeat protein
MGRREGIDSSRACPRTPSSKRSLIPQGIKKSLNLHFRPNPILVAVSLALILMTSGFVYYWMLPKPLPIIPIEDPVIRTPHASIAIDGDANFSDTALLEGWPGDGSPETPYIIDGLDIDRAGNEGSCISISNTQVSFIISNCRCTGVRGLMMSGRDGSGICLRNAANGELVNNIVDSNTIGIFLEDSTSNNLTNNTCYNNSVDGIRFLDSDTNTVANNNCTSNGIGIFLGNSHSNTITNNTCNNNKIGVRLDESDSNTVTNNTLLGNTEHDIYHSDSTSLALNPVDLLFIGLVGITLLGAGWRMAKLSRIVSNRE